MRKIPISGLLESASELIGGFWRRHQRAITGGAKILIVLYALWRIFAFTHLLRSPLIDNVICDPDVGGAAYSSQFFFEPGSIYQNAVETKPPGAYLLFNLVFRLFGESMLPIAWLTIIYHALCALALFFLARRLSGLPAGLATAFLYAAYSANSAGNGLCANFETWTLLPTILTFYLLLEAFSRKVQWRSLLFLAGLFAALGVMFKQQAAMHVMAFGLAIIIETHLAPRNKKVASIPGALGLYVAGGACLTALVMIFFAGKGGLAAMLGALNPSNYVGYASTEGWGFLNLQIKESLLPFFFNTRTLLLLAAMGVIAAFHANQKPEPERLPGSILLPAYIVATMLAVFAGTKFFDHYFMLLIPMLALLAGTWIGKVCQNRMVPLALRITLALLIIPAATNDMKLEVTLGRQALQNITQFGRAAWTQESRFFWTKTTVPRYSSLSHVSRRLAECIRDHSEPGDTLYVWDYAPHLYFYSQMRAPTRHFMYFDVAVDLPRGSGRWHDRVSPHVHNSRQELLSDLRAAGPINVVYYSARSAEIPWFFLTDHAPVYPELKSWIDDHYVEDPKCQNQYFVVLRRSDRL